MKSLVRRLAALAVAAQDAADAASRGARSNPRNQPGTFASLVHCLNSRPPRSAKTPLRITS